MNTVIVRTRNEEKNINRFCQGYSWADRILVADGGSTDLTVVLAKYFANVEVRYFNERVTRNNEWRNPEGKHINFLIDWANEDCGPNDWIIMDDCDSCPNYRLREDAKLIFDSSPEQTMWMLRMYLYGTQQWFPSLTGGGIPPMTADPEGKDANVIDWHGLWGWRAGMNLRWYTGDGFTMTLVEPNVIKDKLDRRHKLYYPYCLLHYFCLDQAETNRKMFFYRKIMNAPQIKHPLEVHGEPKELPLWARP